MMTCGMGTATNVGADSHPDQPVRRARLPRSAFKKSPAPRKLEVWEGRLLFDEEARILLLGLLLENVGADVAVRLGDPTVWRAAVAAL